jgi:hypothetical protein
MREDESGRRDNSCSAKTAVAVESALDESSPLQWPALALREQLLPHLV